MKRAALPFLLFSVVAAAQAVPPLEFKGVPMGAPRAELVERFPGMSCGATSCRLSPDEVWRRECRPGTGDVGCMESVRVRYGFGPAFVESWNVALRDDRVAKVDIRMAEPWFARVVIALTEKYGPPASDRTATIQNRAGASFENRVVTWTLPDGAIRAEQRYAAIDKSVVTLYAPGVEKAEADEFAAKAKGAAKDL